MSRHQGHRERDQKGFTLLEFLHRCRSLLDAILILSIGLLGMGVLTGSMINYNKVAFNRTEAGASAEDKMEELKNTSYASLTGGDDSESIYTRTWTVDTDTPDDDMKTITVTVEWNWKGNTKNIELKSIVAK